MANFIEDRSSETLFVDGSLDSLLPHTSVARTIWAGLKQLDFSGFDAVYRNDKGGRPAIEPRRLAAVWILSLLRGGLSSVELARRSAEDIELRWLLGDAPVEKSTLCTFRTAHADRLKELSTQLLASLAHAGLLPGEAIAVDGSVIRAAASCTASWSNKGLKRQVKKLSEVIESKLMEESSNDLCDALSRRKARLEEAVEVMTALGKTADDDRMTITEPDASKKKLKNGAFGPAHNVQVVTDMSSGAIISAEVIEQGNDYGQLAPQVENAQEELERVSAQLDDESSKPALPTIVCADAAYHDTHQLVDFEKRDIAAVVPARRPRQPKGIPKEYLPEAFDYDPEKDVLVCPQGKVLSPHTLNSRKTAMIYRAKGKQCQQCPFKSQCCPTLQRGRSVSRQLYSEVLATVADRTSSVEGQRYMRDRRITAEGAFARMVHLLSWRRCLTWGKSGAQAETLWRQITHNLLLFTGVWEPIMPQQT
jgi:transposase